MTLTLKWVNCQVASYLLREVNTEEEAFAEMRRFLKVNDITSRETIVRMVEESEYLGEIIPAHKEVEVEGTCFSIYYGSIPRSIHRYLPPFEELDLYVKKEWNGESIIMSKYGECKWYVPLLLYFDDLKQRQEGGKQCH